MDELVAEFYKRFGMKKKDWSLPFIWVRKADTAYDYMINTFTGTRVSTNTCNSITLQKLFENYTFLDYSPCGVLEEAKDD